MSTNNRGYNAECILRWWILQCLIIVLIFCFSSNDILNRRFHCLGIWQCSVTKGMRIQLRAYLKHVARSICHTSRHRTLVRIRGRGEVCTINQALKIYFRKLLTSSQSLTVNLHIKFKKCNFKNLTATKKLRAQKRSAYFRNDVNFDEIGLQFPLRSNSSFTAQRSCSCQEQS